MSQPKKESINLILQSEINERELLSSQFKNMEPINFELLDMQGKKRSLVEFKGKPVLLNFWATWCPPCLEELPSLLKYSEKAKDEYGLVVLAVSIDLSKNDVVHFFNEKKLWPLSSLPFTILLDSSAEIAKKYGTVKFPESYLISSDFKVVKKFTGSQNWDSIEIDKRIKQNL